MPRRYKTQDEFDVLQPPRIRAARDLVDRSSLTIQNIEEANPGVSGKTLKDTNPAYKAARKVHKTKTARVSSEESNVLAPGPGREHAYPPDKPRAKQIKDASRASRIKAGKAVDHAIELHHKMPKGISAAFFNRARDFMEDGSMTLDEFKGMATRAQKLGMETGDIEQNILPQAPTPHNRFHTEMRAQPSYQFPGENLEMGKDDLTKRLRGIKNKKELTTLWDSFLAEDGKYLYKTSEIWEPLDDAIKSVSPKYTGTAKSAKVKLPNTSKLKLPKVNIPVAGGLLAAGATLLSGGNAMAAAGEFIEAENPLSGGALADGTVTGYQQERNNNPLHYGRNGPNVPRPGQRERAQQLRINPSSEMGIETIGRYVKDGWNSIKSLFIK